VAERGRESSTVGKEMARLPSSGRERERIGERGESETSDGGRR
jgi:hypothetical protein